MHTFLIPVYVGKVTDCWDKSPKTVSSSPTLCKAASCSAQQVMLGVRWLRKQQETAQVCSWDAQPQGR